MMGNPAKELPLERLGRCLQRAASARESAAAVEFAETREVYTAVAIAWETLAVEVQGMTGTRRPEQRAPAATPIRGSPTTPN
jgi:hypothetical protein